MMLVKFYDIETECCIYGEYIYENRNEIRREESAKARARERE